MTNDQAKQNINFVEVVKTWLNTNKDVTMLNIYYCKAYVAFPEPRDINTHLDWQGGFELTLRDAIERADLRGYVFIYENHHWIYWPTKRS